MTFSLDEIVPWGRSFDEYVAMFALSEEDLGRRILDCGGGPASFNAVAAASGLQVTSVDPIYAYSADEIGGRIEATATTIAEQVRANTDEFVWTSFADVEELIATRLGAMRRFLGDYAAPESEYRYVPGALPQLPFADASFDLGLCSHLLFLYSEQHGLGFHVASILDLVRICGEVRVFPLLELGSQPSRHLTPVIDELARRGLTATMVEVSYEFQRGGNQMLVIV